MYQDLVCIVGKEVPAEEVERLVSQNPDCAVIQPATVGEIIEKFDTDKPHSITVHHGPDVDGERLALTLCVRTGAVVVAHQV